MKERIIEFLASIIAAVGVCLMMMVAFDIFWGAISLCVWLVLAAIIGLAFTLLYIVMH